MADIVNFVEKVENEFLHRFPIFGYNFFTKIAKHVWRDGEMFRRHGIVAVEVVKFWGIFEVAFHYVLRVAVGGNFHDVKVSNFLLGEEAEISYGQWLTHSPSIQIITV